jgi:tetraacyldisaccharide 4'-kinase
MLKKVKKYLSIIGFVMLIPAAWIYGLAIWFINFSYIYGIRRIYRYNKIIPIISVGNLRVGGTGKTPCIEYLLHLLEENFHTVVISRGYKRKVHGYRIASIVDNAQTIGDEPYQLYKKFATKDSKIQVVVSEDRAKAVQKLLSDYPNTNIILLDDGFQHRRLDRKLNILLSSFHEPFFEDFLLPAGRLREHRQAATRADVIIVTKCPPLLTHGRKESIREHIAKYCTKSKAPAIFFTSIRYGTPKSLYASYIGDFAEHIVLVTGIADPGPLVQYIGKTYQLIHHIAFKDHHSFTQKDLKKIVSIFNQVTYKKKCILTTEKDSMRLMESSLAFIVRKIPIFFLPISMEFIEGEEAFTQLIWNSIKR